MWSYIGNEARFVALPDRNVFHSAFSLNFVEWLAPGGSRHFKGGGGRDNASEIMEKWRSGSGAAACPVEVLSLVAESH